MKILITGVKGFMATNFAGHYLQDTNYTVVGVSNEPIKLREKLVISNVKQKYPKRFSLYSSDITNSYKLKLILDKEEPDIILNFASQTEVIKSFEQPYGFFKTNLEGVVHLLEWLRHNSKETRMIQFSTEAVFASGGSKGKEDDPLFPRNPYSASKAAAEQYIQAYNFCFGTNVQIARPVNNYGPYQNLNKLIAKIIVKCIKNETFKLYAEEHPLKRHWLYIDDTCAATDIIIDKGKKDEVYNIVPETSFTTEEVVMRILDIAGKENIFMGYLKGRQKDQEHYNLDGSKLKKLGWKPAYSLDDGIKKTIRWFESNPSWFNQNGRAQVSE